MRRTRRRPLAALALLALLALVAAACGGDDDDDGETSSDSSDDTASDDTSSDDTKVEETAPEDDPEEVSMAAAEELVAELGLPLTTAQEACLGEELADEFDADELEELREEDDLSDELADRAAEVLDLCLPLDDVIYLSAIAQGLTPAQADCVAEQIADEFTWSDFINGDEAILDSFEDAAANCGTTATTGAASTISVPTIPATTTTTQPAVTTTTPPGTGAAPPGTQVSIFDTAPGECWNQADYDIDAQVYTVVDCAGSHDTETFAVFDLPDGPFPGDDAVQSAASDGCIERFEPYVGLDYASSQYYESFFSPTQVTWDDPALHDREVVCILYVPENPDDPASAFVATTGTARGSGR